MLQSYLYKQKYFNTSVSDILGLLGLTRTNLDRGKATELVGKYGNDSFDHYKLWKDKSFYFADAVEGFISYRNFDGLMMALADPVADAKDVAILIDAFKQDCLKRNQEPCFFQTSSLYLNSYQGLGFSNIKIGHELIVDISKFDLQDSDKQGLRSRLRQLDSFRYKVRHYRKPNEAKFLQDLTRVSKEWLAKGEEEKCFALGSFDLDSIKASTVMTVEDVAGNIVAFATVVPSGRSKELNIDLLRQAPAIAVEALEFLLAYTILFFGELNYERINLGMIPHVIKEGCLDRDSVIQKALLRKMHYLFVQPSLIDVKKSFANQLRPRYFCFI